MNRAVIRRCSLTFVVLLLASCKATGSLLYEKAATDPLDGYPGSLAKAGANTEMDWGPKQETLLNEFKTLKDATEELKHRLDDVRAEKQNLEAQMKTQSAELQKEKSLRVQAEAETEMLRQRRSDLDARLLSLSIEKAKLEQENLVAKIEGLKAKLDQVNSSPMEAAATPPRGR